jgi:phosphohistidine swiveling domain-containing protein
MVGVNPPGPDAEPAAPTPTAAEVGGKAAALFELERAGFRVPITFCSPPDLAAAVAAIDGPVAVRSSATVEDGREASFAGQFESILGLEGLAAVEAAVETCKASVHTDGVREYCRQNGIDHATVRMEVIVQQMIHRPELAGVAFTVNPVTGHDEVVIDAVEGVAEDLLAGKVESLPAEHPLMVEHRPAIEDVALRVQRHYGAPQDIEFAIQDGVLYLLQARPITRITFSPDLGEWTNADFRDGGVSSDVCPPLMWSLYDFVWESSLKEFLREIRLLGAEEDWQAGKIFFGRPYWNMGGVKRCLARLPGFVEREFDEDLSIECDYEGDGVVTPLSLRSILRAIPTLRAIGRVYAESLAHNQRFLDEVFPRLAEAYEQPPVPEDLTESLRRLIEDCYQQTETTYFRTIYLSTIAKTDLLEAFPDVDYPALVSALPQLEHLAPTRVLQEMAQRGEEGLEAVMQRFRHHSRRELDLRCPRWDEDPDHVRELLEHFKDGAAGSDPRPHYERVRAETRAALPFWKRRKFERKLDRLRTFLWMREELRDRSMRVYYLIRRYVLALATERGLGDDVHHLTWQQLLANDTSQLEAQRAYVERYRNFTPPNEIGARYRQDDAPAEGALEGIAASRGRAEGVARVARTVEEALGVEKGAILVCPFTDPGWTPVLNRVAAVVTESGGLLSHAAVICREYGIPAVLGIKQATSRIPDGAQVIVDGARGTVELVD